MQTQSTGKVQECIQDHEAIKHRPARGSFGADREYEFKAVVTELLDRLVKLRSTIKTKQKRTHLQAQAAVRVQSAYRGHLVRQVRPPRIATGTTADSSSSDEAFSLIEQALDFQLQSRSLKYSSWRSSNTG